jgi:hypothetical protein
MLARYYTPTAGRFLSVDPSRKSINPLDPQSWNRFSYTLNNPVKLVDKNGEYPTSIHNQIVDRAFPGLTNAQRQILKEASRRVDRDQSTAGAYKHGMRAPGQSVAEASKLADNFVQNNQQAAQNQQQRHEAAGGEGLASGALSSFGNALHTVTDSQSPAHQGFQEWKGTEGVGNKVDAAQHYANEANPSQENINTAVNAAQDAFRKTFGDKAADAATKPSEKKREDP